MALKGPRTLHVEVAELEMLVLGTLIPQGQLLGAGSEGLAVRSPCDARLRRIRLEPRRGTFVVELEPAIRA